MTKDCAKCGLHRPVTKFSRKRGVYQSYCKDCVRAYSRAWMREKYQKKLETKALRNPRRYSLCSCGDYYTVPLDKRSERNSCRNCRGMKTGRVPVENVWNQIRRV